MKKVALLSFHFWYNYGTCFQAYALWKVLENLNIESEYLNFGWKYPISDSEYWENNWNYSKPKKIWKEIKYRLRTYICAILNKQFVKRLQFDYVTISNNRLFEKFFKAYIVESKRIDSQILKKLERDYCLFIVGSDQCWNPDNCEEKYFKNFLLEFVSDKKKKVSYATSIGKTNISSQVETLFREYLSNFASLSCREKTGCEIIERVTGIQVEHVLDPTLLLNRDQWLEIADQYRINEKFVLCYILGQKEEIVKSAIEYARINAYNVKIITTNPTLVSIYFKNTLCNVGPKEFLYLIDSCECVFTDSFHGTIFSINFNKEFFSFMKREGGYNHSDNSRIRDVLKVFNLENRLISGLDYAELSTTMIDYCKVNQIIEEKRKNSYSYLNSILP